MQSLIPGSKPRSQGTARSPSRHQSRKCSPGGPLVAACDSCNKRDSAPRRPSRTAPYSWKPKQSPAWPRPARMTDLLPVPRASHQAMWLHPRPKARPRPRASLPANSQFRPGHAPRELSRPGPASPFPKPSPLLPPTTETSSCLQPRSCFTALYTALLKFDMHGRDPMKILKLKKAVTLVLVTEAGGLVEFPTFSLKMF